MNATYSIDHLNAISHVANVLSGSDLNAGAVAANKPKAASTSHYDSQGTSIGTVSTTSYEGLSFGADGKISGGSLAHESSTPEGSKLTTTSVAFQPDGRPANAAITVHNLHTDGEFRKVAMDMSKAVWNEGFTIESGEVSVNTVDPANNVKTHDGTIQFLNQKLASASFTHYAKDSSGTVTGYSELDYSNAKFLGHALIGGEYSLTHHNPDKTVKAKSVIAVSPLGHIQSIQSTNLDSTAAVKTTVSVDFSGVTFNARSQAHSGDLKYTANDAQGNKLSDTIMTYQNAIPASSQIISYAGQAVQSKIVVDYSQSTFNNKNQVVSSTKKVDLYSGDGKLVSSNVVVYDSSGNKLPAGSSVQALPPKTLTAVVLPQINMNKLSAAAAATTQTEDRKEKRRASDNSLQELRVTTMQDGKPVSTLVTTYDTDGTTVIKTYTIDLSSLAFDPSTNAVSGSLGMQTHLGGNILHAESSVQF